MGKPSESASFSIWDRENALLRLPTTYEGSKEAPTNIKATVMLPLIGNKRRQSIATKAKHYHIQYPETYNNEWYWNRKEDINNFSPQENSLIRIFWANQFKEKFRETNEIPEAK